MNNLLTAEEFCKSFKPTGKTWQENFHQTIIEFAKLHVEKFAEEIGISPNLVEEYLELHVK